MALTHRPSLSMARIGLSWRKQEINWTLSSQVRCVHRDTGLSLRPVHLSDSCLTAVCHVSQGNVCFTSSRSLLRYQTLRHVHCSERCLSPLSDRNKQISKSDEVCCNAWEAGGSLTSMCCCILHHFWQSICSCLTEQDWIHTCAGLNRVDD